MRVGAHKRGLNHSLFSCGRQSALNLLGALYLTRLDRRMDQLRQRGALFAYVRTMDDVVLLARTRWQLRRCTKRLPRSA